MLFGYHQFLLSNVQTREDEANSMGCQVLVNHKGITQSSQSVRFHHCSTLLQVKWKLEKKPSRAFEWTENERQAFEFLSDKEQGDMADPLRGHINANVYNAHSVYKRVCESFNVDCNIDIYAPYATKCGGLLDAKSPCASLPARIEGYHHQSEQLSKFL